MMRLLIATENPGKIREMQALLTGLDVELVSPKSIGIDLKVVEDGATYAENAGKKALAYARASRLISIADDSGLEVDALNGAPGLYSARYSPKPGATDADRLVYLLQNLQGKPRPWKAHFHATIAIAVPPGDGDAEGRVQFADGDCHGEIIPEQRGNNGFGYDPVFFIPALNRTMAELSMDEKNRLSHRALAIQNAKPVLQQLTG
ncbi:MAG: RdgB/HAM1 family non-canonical purine NTP pyrophosphatase [Anaerolineales bacterium]